MPGEHHGLLVIDKPSGITSRAAVTRAQGWFPRATRMGHTGTLDPLATGVLVLCLGCATRLAEYVQRMRKTYRAGFLLGACSDSDDADGVITPALGAPAPDEETIRSVLSQFEGEQEQVPPVFSASKVDGQRAYKLARRGLDVELQPRRVVIYRINLLAYRFPHLDLEIECSKGTYIRSLARDLGKRLECGAYVASLRRTRVGCFAAESALMLDASPTAAIAALLPVYSALSELPRAVITADGVTRLKQGQALEKERVHTQTEIPAEAEAAAFDEKGSLIGVIQYQPERWRPVKILSSSHR